MGLSNFGGTQPFLNTAIGSANYGAGGGLLNPSSPASFGNYASGSGLVNPSSFPNYANRSGLLNPSTNPELQSYFQAASRPLKQEYRNVTAPNILANAAETGTVGGSGEKHAFKQAENQLAGGLADLSASIYEPAYAQNLGALENIYGTQLGAAQTAYGQGLNATENAISGAPGLAQGAYIPAQELQASGMLPIQGLQQLGQGLGPAAGNAGTSVNLQSGFGSMK